MARSIAELVEEIDYVAGAGDEHRFRLRVAVGDPIIDDHFPGDRVMAAYLQLLVVVQRARRVWPELTRFHGADRVKFKAMLRPGDAFTLVLTRRRDSVTFVLGQDDATTTEGRLVFER